MGTGYVVVIVDNEWQWDLNSGLFWYHIEVCYHERILICLIVSWICWKYWLVEINHSHTKSLSVESLFQKIWNSCITRIRSYIRGSKRSGIIYLIQLMPPSPWDCIPLVCCYSIFYLTPILWFDSVKLVFLIRFFLRLFVILFFVDSKFHGDVRGQLV